MRLPISLYLPSGNDCADYKSGQVSSSCIDNVTVFIVGFQWLLLLFVQALVSETC